jgi:hypothetical protein
MMSCPARSAGSIPSTIREAHDAGVAVAVPGGGVLAVVGGGVDVGTVVVGGTVVTDEDVGALETAAPLVRVPDGAGEPVQAAASDVSPTARTASTAGTAGTAGRAVTAGLPDVPVRRRRGCDAILRP